MTTHTAPRRATQALAALTAVVAAVSLAACGGGGPLAGALSGPERHQLNSVWTARIAATDGADIPASVRNERVKTLYTACQQVAPGQPLLAAVVATCGPISTIEKLDAVFETRCDRPTKQCVRALDRLASANDQNATAAKAVNAQVGEATDDVACRAQLTMTDAQLTAASNLSAAYRTLALGIEQGDTDIADLGRRRIADAQAILKPPGTVQQRTKQLQTDCGINDAN